jgi:hypothetical protein
MGESHLTAPEAASYELALANRKLVTVVMGMTLLMGLVACLAYLAGRSVTGIRANQESRMVVPPPVIVEPEAKGEEPVAEPVATPVPSPTVTPVSSPTVTPVAPPTAPPVAAPAPVDHPVAGTVPGRIRRLYLQVAAAELPGFQPLRSELERAGFPLEIARIDRKHRLLVGPLRDEQQKVELQMRLTAAGHPSFVREY